MNIAIRTDKVESTLAAADPLDHLADKLFHKMAPMASTPAPRSMKTWSSGSPP
jgi:hypothetical protein